jgi:tetratricopeptide (TPR) repeat protein
MADTAAHLVDRVLPEVPVRQWVLSLPFALRYRLAYDAGLTSAVLGVFVRTVFASLRRRARRQWNVARGQCGAVTFVQRFGDALPPDDAEVARVVGAGGGRIARLLERRGLGPGADPTEADPLLEGDPLLAELYGASVASRAEEAIEPLHLALRLDPRSASGHHEVACLYDRLGRTEEALAAEQRAMQLAPAFAPAHLIATALYVKLGREADARAAASELMRLAPNFTIESLLRRVPGTSDLDPDLLRRAGLPES